MLSGGLATFFIWKDIRLLVLGNVCRRSWFVNFQPQLRQPRRYRCHVYAPYLLKFVAKFDMTRGTQKAGRRERKGKGEK